MLDLSRAGARWSVTVSGPAGSWSQELSPRHAELLYLLALHPAGRTAAELAGDLFGDPTPYGDGTGGDVPVRRNLGGCSPTGRTASRGSGGRLLRPDDPRDLLPHSMAPAVRRTRSARAEGAEGRARPGDAE